MVKPGLLSGADAAWLNAELAWLRARVVTQAVPPLVLTQGPGGQVLADQGPGGPFWAEITAVGSVGTDTGCGRAHAWRELWQDHDSDCLVERPAGRSGTTTVNPAFEVMERTAAVGDFVWLHPPERGFPSYRFGLPATSGSGVLCVGPIVTAISCSGGVLSYTTKYLRIDFGARTVTLTDTVCS